MDFDFTPLLPTMTGPGTGAGDAYAAQLTNEDTSQHPKFETEVKTEDGLEANTSTDVVMTEPAQPAILPPIRLNDYYGTLQTPQPSTPAPESHTQPYQPIRLDDFYAAATEHDSDGISPSSEASEPPYSPEEVDGFERAVLKKQKHKPMTAAQQKEAVRALQAKLKQFPPPKEKALPLSALLVASPPPRYPGAMVVELRELRGGDVDVGMVEERGQGQGLAKVGQKVCSLLSMSLPPGLKLHALKSSV